MYRCIRAITHAKRKKWFYWTGEDITEVRVNGETDLLYTNPISGGVDIVRPVTFDEVRFDDDKATATLDIAFGQIDALGIYEFPRIEGTASHRGIRNGQTITLSTSW